MTADCIDDNDAARFACGSLDEIARLRIEHHVDACSSCRVLVAELARQSTSERPPETLLPPGAMVGRYLLGGVLGAGAMGVVYSAEDPQLGRHVALKVLRPRATAPLGSTAPVSVDEAEAEGRLLAEAHALAQLSHPNVVTVFDAGRWRAQVFIALELVRGGTLGEWLFVGRRSLEQVLAHFRAAGTGLAAAHSAGIVHRDFKPDNVLVGDDGRVRVTDFGLARALANASEPGSLAGTPAYMAPEQRESGIADARSDQYAFSVALWEALFGSLPQARPGTARRHSGVGRVPGRIRRVVERGLSRDPAARYPSMAAMVAALAWDPAARRRTVWVAALVLALIGGIALTLARSSQRARLCQSGGDRFASVISPDRWRALAELKNGGEGPLAVEAAQRRRDRVAQLEDYRARWIASYSDACSATRLRGDQSDELMELRMSCLESRLEGANALVGLLERNDPVMERRMAGREVLEPLEPCADRAALLEPLRPPRDQTTRERIANVRAAIGRVKVLENAGEYKSAIAKVKPLVAEARAIGYTPLLAETLLYLCSAEDHDSDPAAESDLLETALIAEAAHHDHVVADARAMLFWATCVRNGHVDQADRLGREAEAAIARAGGNQRMEDLLLNGRAGLATDPKVSEKLYRQLIARLEARPGPPPLSLGQAENNLATLYLDNKRPQEALPHFDRAIAIEEALVGRHHPAVLMVRRNRAMALGGLGHPRDLLGEVRKLAADTEVAVGPDHLDTGYALMLYAQSLADTAAGRAEAVAELARALAIFSAKLPPENQPAADAHGLLCDVLVQLKRFTEAEPHCREMLAFVEKAPGVDNQDLGPVLVSHAEFLLGSGAAPQARAELERALQLMPAAKWPPAALALWQFTMARAIVATRGDAAKARELAAHAETEWTKDDDKEALAQLRTWRKRSL